MRKSAIIGAAGLAVGLGGFAHGAGTVVNMSGATLLQNFCEKPAAYNDFIDVDGNGVAGSLGTGVQDLAPSNSTTGYWVFTYRSSGSGNGFRDLINHCVDFDTTPAGDGLFLCGEQTGLEVAGTPTSRNPVDAYQNRIKFIANGLATGAYNVLNPGGHPNRTNTTTLQATTNTTGPDGTRIDIAILDVPGRWFVRLGAASDAGPFKTPGVIGYGRTDKVAVTKTGAATTQANSLTSLTNARTPSTTFNLFDPSNPGAANANTLFDTPLFWAPIGPMANFGTGLSQIKITELQHLFSTGRMPSGENLMAHTRDIGSGTRNAWQNALGIDPGFGIGENIGLATSVAANDLLGADYQPTNKGSNSRMEATVFNHRLGIGYAGTERAVDGGWALPLNSPDARADFLSVRNDIYPGGTQYVRPTIDSLLDNNENGWVIGGPAALVTRGDPNAASVADGGAANGRPAMANNAAAEWVNNVRESIEAFIAVPGDVDNIGMPGELAATKFILTPALDNVKDLVIPTTLVPNPDFNAALQAYTRGNNVHQNAVYATFNNNGIGRSARTSLSGPATYSDGVVTGSSYIRQDGTLWLYSTTLPLRSKVCGDFNGDGLRNLNDVPEMVKAWQQRNGGGAWVAPAGTGAIAGAPGGEAIIEALGDFNGDGNFGNTGGASPVADRIDVRYFADGLAIDPGTGLLNRRAGFIAVDTSYGCNFFGTLIGPGANGIRHYQSGASAADIAGASGVTPGFTPTGSDGRIDGKDIDYIYAQFKSQKNSKIVDGEATWSNLSEAVYFDLSADVNGDLVVNQVDVDLVVLQFLNTRYGDVNLDGTVDAADTTIINASIATPPATRTWSNGDVNGDNIVNAADLALANAAIAAQATQPRPSCDADLDNGAGSGVPDGGVDINDLLYFLAKFEAGSVCADLDNGAVGGFPDGGVDINDLLYFLARFESGC